MKGSSKCNYWSLCVKGEGLFTYLVRLALLKTMSHNQMREVLLFVCSKTADETNLSSKLPVAENMRGLRKKALLGIP